MSARILSGLTEDEAQDALRGASHRNAALGLRIEALDGRFALVVDGGDAARYPELVERIVREVQPHRFAIAAAETAIAEQITQAIQAPPGSDAHSRALEQICSLLEYRFVPFLFGLGDFVDGFLPPPSAPPRDGELTLDGACWCFNGARSQIRGEYEARFRVAPNGSLAALELGFMSPEVARGAQIVPAGAESSARVIAGYCVEVQPGEPSSDKTRWAFRARKVSPPHSGS